MKTKQEQIDKMASIIFETINRENIDRFVEDKDGNLVSVETVGIEGIAEALIENGYGDVSEYKAEIKRLKADFITLECNYDKAYDENKELKTENANLKILNDKFRECIGYLKAEIKQAQIDVLNKVKSFTIYDDNYLDGYVFIDDINDLIKEVQGE